MRKIERFNTKTQFYDSSSKQLAVRLLLESLLKVLKRCLTKIHGGGATDRKLLEKQKRGKARSKQFGKVEIPQEAFIGVLKINKET